MKILALFGFLIFAQTTFAQPKALTSVYDVLTLFDRDVIDPYNPNARVPVVGFKVRKTNAANDDALYFNGPPKKYMWGMTLVELDTFKSSTDLDHVFDKQIPELIRRNTQHGTMILSGRLGALLENDMLQRFLRMFEDGGVKIPGAQAILAATRHSFLIEVSRGAELAKGVSVLSLEPQALYKYTIGRHELLFFTQEQLKKILGLGSACKSSLTDEQKNIWNAIKQASGG